MSNKETFQTPCSIPPPLLLSMSALYQGCTLDLAGLTLCHETMADPVAESNTKQPPTVLTRNATAGKSISFILGVSVGHHSSIALTSIVYPVTD